MRRYLPSVRVSYRRTAYQTLSGGLRAATTVRASDSKLDAHSRPREHVDERVDTEQVDLAAHKIADAWLRNAQQACRRTLRQFVSLNETPDFNHQFRTKPQALGLLRAEAKIPKDVSGGLLNLHRHVCFLRRRS